VGTKFPASSMKEQEVRAYREIERQNMQKILDAYLLFCGKMGVQSSLMSLSMNMSDSFVFEFFMSFIKR
jgi:hypothetical protein